MNKPDTRALAKRRKAVESAAAVGLLLVAAGLMVPFASLQNVALVGAMKWVYAAGAVIYTVARMVDINGPADSLRLRRLRRLEAWAGIAFAVAAAFWFYNSHRLGPAAGSLALLRDTILFSLVGAMIQLVASWLLTRQLRREVAGDGPGVRKK